MKVAVFHLARNLLQLLKSHQNVRVCVCERVCVCLCVLGGSTG